MRETFSIIRFHIILIAVTSHIVFGWLFSGNYLVWTALIAGLDWLLINLANRVSDITEDLANGIPGTERVARSRIGFLVFFFALLAGSFVFTAIKYPQLTPWRILIQITGLLYNFRIIPGAKGWYRLKDRYFFKNFLSAFGFFITCFLYTLAMAGYEPLVGWGAVVALVIFFVPYELTFEIFYDLRDVEGDLKANVHTYPVVHGAKTAESIIYGLLIFSGAAMIAFLLSGLLGAREGLMAAGPLLQYFILKPRIARGVTTGDCIMVTHIGSALLVLYLIGTALWLRANLPPNIFLPDMLS